MAGRGGRKNIERGRRFKAARKAAGLTQPKAATAAGVSPATVTRSEAGATIKTEQTMALAAAYGVSVDDLLGTTTRVVLDDPVPPEIQRFARRYGWGALVGVATAMEKGMPITSLDDAAPGPKPR